MARRPLILGLTVLIVGPNSSCMSSEGQDPPVPVKIQQEQTEAVRILALGDSYTIGEGLLPEQSWPIQLTRLLRQGALNVDPPQIIATTGWTTVDLLREIAQTNLNPPYDLVTLLIGVNDQFQGKNDDWYRDGFTKLLLKAIDLAGGNPRRVIVLSIPDYSVTPFGQRFDPTAIRAVLDRFNEINAELSTKAGVPYIDVTQISRAAASDLSLLAPDKLHPSETMYAEWVRLLVPVAVAALRANKR